MIVTVTRTVMDGTVVRWYPTTLAEEHKRPIITASRNGVRIDAWLTDLADSRADAFTGGPLTRLDDAREAWQRLRRDNRADVDSFATHSRRGLNGPLEPIQRGPEEAGSR